MLLTFHKSNNILRATLTNDVGVLETGAVVTVTIKDKAGTALVTGASMPEVGTGEYEYNISNILLPTEDEIYRGEVTASKSGNTRFAVIPFKNIMDVD